MSNPKTNCRFGISVKFYTSYVREVWVKKNRPNCCSLSQMSCRRVTPFITFDVVVHKLLHIFVVPSPNVDRLAIPRDRLHTRFLDVLSDFSIQLQRLGLDATLEY